MRILIGVHHFPPKFSGGAEGRAFRTAKELVNQGRSVQVLTVEEINNKSSSDLKIDEYEGLQVYRISMTNPFGQTEEYNNFQIRNILRRVIGEFKPDIFHLIGGYLLSGSAIDEAEQLGVPVVVSLTDFWYLCPRITLFRTDKTLSRLPIDFTECVQCLNREKRRYKYLELFSPRITRIIAENQSQKRDQLKTRYGFLIESLAKASRIISPSRFIKSIYTEAGIDPEKIIYMRQGVNLPETIKGKRKKSRSTPFRVGYIGQIAEHKGVHVLLKAFKLLDDRFELLVYGDITKHPAYSHKIMNNVASSKRIKYMGVYSGDDKLNLYNKVDCVVVPSIWYENSPNVIIEAQSFQKPVIASDIGGMKEMVEEGVTGQLFSVNNSEALATAIQTIQKNYEDYNFSNLPYTSISAEIRKLVHIYKALVSGGTSE